MRVTQGDESARSGVEAVTTQGQEDRTAIRMDRAGGEEGRLSRRRLPRVAGFRLECLPGLPAGRPFAGRR
jgi:hypothetical protein